MTRVTKLIVENKVLMWVLLVFVALLSAGLTADLARNFNESERTEFLDLEAKRRGIELMSQTLNGNLMGAVSMLGLLDPDIKREANGGAGEGNPRIAKILGSLAEAHAADGVFVVAANGVIGSSWDSSGKPSTGLDVKFRPYYKMAMNGNDNVYAAVSLARGERSLYFSTPIYDENSLKHRTLGAVVARTGIRKIDELLQHSADIAILLSPQGVVFASNRKEWIGYLAGQVTAERLKEIRNLKQFGNMFETQQPSVLPMSVSRGILTLDDKHYAVSTAPVRWNDPFGEWQLVLMEDLSRTVPIGKWLPVSFFVGFIVFVLGALVNKLLSGHYAQILANEQLAIYSREQQASGDRKSRLADAALKLQRSKTQSELVQNYLGEAHHMFGVLQGVVYVLDAGATSTMHLAGSYACAEQLPEALTVGEGLLGQCAFERKFQVINGSAEGFFAIRSGLGETQPSAILLIPILLNESLRGVAEVALLKAPEKKDLSQFEEMTALLAMNLEILGRSIHTERALSATLAAEKAQAEELNFQQALIDTIPYPLFYKDAEACFLGVNRAYEEAFNIKRADIVGKQVLDLEYLPKDDRLAYQREDTEMIALARSVRREMQMPYGNGEIHDVIYSVSGFHRADGKPGGLVGTFMDISEIKSAERGLERLADAERLNRLTLGRETRILELKTEINRLAEAAGETKPYAIALVETVGDHLLEPHPDYATSLESNVAGVLQLNELVDLEALQKLFTSFCESVGIAAAIIDLQGNVLVSSRWQRACTDFHRVNPDSCARCIESDTGLALKLEAGERFTMYRCKNGMTDCASPIIVDGQHLANVFIGQFHVGEPDMKFFRKQAKQYNYPEADYLEAISAAPVVDEKRLPVILGFLSGFAQMVSETSLARRRADMAQQRLVEQADLLKRERIVAMSLAEDAEQARQALIKEDGAQA